VEHIFMLFVTTVPDVKYPCFVYYVWGLGGGLEV